ncbi:type IV secretion system protein VirB10 [Cupriavidus necator]
MTRQEAPALNQAGERGVPGVYASAKRARVRAVWIVLVIVLGMACAAAGAAMFLKRLEGQVQQRKQTERKDAQKARPSETSHDFAADKARIEKDQQRQLPPPAAARMPAGQSSQAFGGTGTPSILPAASSPGGGEVGVTALDPTEARRLNGDVVLEFKRSSSARVEAAAASEHSPRGGSAFDERLSPSTLASVKAGRLPELSYLLKRGTVIPCGTRTRIVTTYPGMTSCIVSRDVYSANGKTLLIRAGSEVTGEQRSALLQGQARIFVLWSRIDLSDGNFAQLDSPGADALGASGQEASVDTHFWDRFGGALLLSVVGDVGQVLSNLTTRAGSTSISVSGTASAMQQVMAETLKHTLNIPPTAYSNQGAQINIFVARDVDFRSVYELASQ